VKLNRSADAVPVVREATAIASQSVPDQEPRQGRKILLMGAPIGIGNRGVSALGTSVVRLFHEVCPTAQISLLIGNRDSLPIEVRVEGKIRKLGVVNFRNSPRAKLAQQLWWIALLAFIYRLLPFEKCRTAIKSLNPCVAAISEADVVADIRGGDSFSDIYGVRNFLMGSLPVLSVIWIRGSIALLPQTYGPYASFIARYVSRYIILSANVILSRDAHGIKVVEELTGGKRQATFCPDVAFALEPVAASHVEVIPPIPSRPEKVLVGLNVNGLMFNGGYTRDNMFGLKLDYPVFLKELLNELLRNPSIEVLLVPHTIAPPGSVESDNEASRLLAESVSPALAARVHLVMGSPDQHELKGIIGTCDFFIGSRMHACIAALSQGIPAVGVAYSRKFSGVFASVGAEKWVVDGKVQNVSAAIKETLHLFGEREFLAGHLRRSVPAAQENLRKQFERMVSSGS